MKNRGIYFILVLLFLTGMVSGLRAFKGPEEKGFPPPPAGGPGFPPPEGRNFLPEKMLENLTRQMQLTPQQQAVFLDGAKNGREEEVRVNAINRKIQENLEKELFKDQPDMKVIFGYTQEINQHVSSVQMKRAEHIIQFMKALNQKQKKTFRKIFSQRDRRMPERFAEWKAVMDLIMRLNPEQLKKLSRMSPEQIEKL